MVAGEIQDVLKHNFHTVKELFPRLDQLGKINGHYDTNSGDCPGANYNSLESDYEARERIAQNIRDHWLSIWWGLQNDPALPIFAPT